MSQSIKNPTLAALRAMLTAPAPVVAKPTSAPKAPSAKKPLPAPTTDLRALTNTKPHVRIPYAGPAPKTPASAAKLRRTAMHECECRMCALALYPPKTFAEYEALGLVQPSMNALEALQGKRRELRIAPRPYTEAQAALAAELDAGPEWAEGVFQ